MFGKKEKTLKNRFVLNKDLYFQNKDLYFNVVCQTTKKDLDSLNTVSWGLSDPVVTDLKSQTNGTAL